MRVVLVNPLPNIDKRQRKINGKIPPLGLLYIAGNLQRHGHKVIIVDANVNEYTNDIIAKLVCECRPDIIGMTCNTPNYSVIKDLARLFRKNINVPIVIGGIHPTALPSLCLNTGLFDYVVIGEGEISFTELVDHLYDSSTIANIPGIGFRHNSQIIINKPKVIEDINALPPKAWHLIDMKRYCPSPGSYMRQPAISTIWGRGCPYNCIYCCLNAIFQNITRSHSINIIASEIEILRSKGIRDLNIWDSIFTNDHEWVRKVCKVIKKFGIVWNCVTRVDMVDRDILAVMADAGCYEIGYGIETASDKSLMLMKKEATLQKALETVSLTRKLGIWVKCFFTIGYPWETEKDIEQTLRFAKRLGSDFATFSIVSPYPGCSLFERIKDRLTDDDFKGMSHLSGKNNVSEHLNQEQLIKLVNKGYRGYYLRLGYIWRAINRIRSVEDIRHNLNAVRDIFFVKENKEDAC